MIDFAGLLPRNPVIVVLGQRLEEKEKALSQCALERLKTAAFLHDYWQEPLRKSHIIVVGFAQGLDIEVVDAMAHYLLNECPYYVDEHYLHCMDDAFKTTREYMEAALKLLEVEGIDARDILLVASEYQMMHVELATRPLMAGRTLRCIPTLNSNLPGAH